MFIQTAPTVRTANLVLDKCDNPSGWPYSRLFKKVLRRISYGAREFLACGLPLHGQKRLAPLAKRSTCSKTSRIGDLGNFLIVFTKSPYLLPCLPHRNRFFRLNRGGRYTIGRREKSGRKCREEGGNEMLWE